ncbi:MAG TPA: 4,5-DOPA dioxygenase extradiol [Spongiibacteraceae bacterium]|nr:4,5-DOPA dioxygenase extradiol [Spongiibacteraceae bacterium]HCS26358.1 4,5-DOPA dioxygenase extradiol [Spongiibacteraceae bacterium]|tara:strand:- start:462 stop:1232 length:771 start_codon:yes stop_codon:yes gene_type:complete
MSQPALFLGHGTPMNALHSNTFTDDWRGFVKDRHPPRAILCISAHWCTRGSFVTANDYPKTIHDFSGFPQSLSQIHYPCPGAPELAAEISHRSAGEIDLSFDWGLDHGTWSLLVHLYPAADIPVVQLSIDISKSPESLFHTGRSLQWLRDEGVMVIGSGNIVHNIQQWLQHPDAPFEWAQQFDQAVAAALAAEDNKALIHYSSLPGADMAVPTPEHYLPLLAIAGLRRPADQLQMTSYPPATMEQCSMRSLCLSEM